MARTFEEPCLWFHCNFDGGSQPQDARGLAAATDCDSFAVDANLSDPQWGYVNPTTLSDASHLSLRTQDGSRTMRSIRLRSILRPYNFPTQCLISLSANPEGVGPVDGIAKRAKLSSSWKNLSGSRPQTVPWCNSPAHFVLPSIIPSKSRGIPGLKHPLVCK